MLYREISSINLTGKLVKKVKNKPYGFFLICLLLVLWFVASGSKLLYILAMVLVTVIVCGFIMINDKRVVDIYDNGLLIYNPKNSSEATFVNINNIVSYKCERHFLRESIVTINTRNESIDVIGYKVYPIIHSLKKAIA